MIEIIILFITTMSIIIIEHHYTLLVKQIQRQLKRNDQRLMLLQSILNQLENKEKLYGKKEQTQEIENHQN